MRNLSAWTYIVLSAVVMLVAYIVARFWLSEEDASRIGDFVFSFLLAARIFHDERKGK